MVCEPTPNLIERIQAGISTSPSSPMSIAAAPPRSCGSSSSSGSPPPATACTRRPVAAGARAPHLRLAPIGDGGAESAGRAFRIPYVSWHSTAVGAAVRRALRSRCCRERRRPGMRILGPSDGFPALPSCKIGLIRTRGEENPLADALGVHIKQSLDNLGSGRVSLPDAAEYGRCWAYLGSVRGVARGGGVTKPFLADGSGPGHCRRARRPRRARRAPTARETVRRTRPPATPDGSEPVLSRSCRRSATGWLPARLPYRQS